MFQRTLVPEEPTEESLASVDLRSALLSRSTPRHRNAMLAPVPLGLQHV